MVGEKTDKDEIRLCIRLGNGYVGGMMSGWKDGQANVVVEWCPGFFSSAIGIVWKKEHYNNHYHQYLLLVVIVSLS